MKNVRLFAVAAALGMFASTVAAAETTKAEVKWSGDDTVIKVDLGEKLIVTAPTASVTLDGKTTECQNGTDANGDGLVDSMVYGIAPSINTAQGWLYNNAKYWASTTDSSIESILGLSGYRFLAPGSAEVEEEVFVDQFSGDVYDSIEAAFAGLEEKGYITVARNGEGDITAVQIPYAEDTSFGLWHEYVKLSVVNTAVGGRNTDENVMEDVVDFMVSGSKLEDNTLYDLQMIRTTKLQRGNSTSYNITVNDGSNAPVALNYFSDVYPGSVVLVNSSRKGYYLDEPSYGTLAGNPKTTAASKYFWAAATSSDLHYITDTNLVNVKMVVTNDGTQYDKYITTGNVSYLNELTGVTALNDEYDIISTGDIDAFAYVTPTNGKDSVDGLTLNIVDYTTAKVEIKKVNASGKTTWVEVDKDNADVYFNATYISAGNCLVNGKPVEELHKLDGYNLTGLTLLEKAEENTFVEYSYDAVDAKNYVATTQKRYEIVSKASKATDFVTELSPRGTVYAVTTPLYTASQEENTTTYNGISRLGKSGYVTLVDIGDCNASDDYNAGIEYANAYVVDSFKITEDQAKLQDYLISVGEETFTLVGYDQPQEQDVSGYGAPVVAGDANNANYLKEITAPANRFGWYEIFDLPENDTDKYVLLTNRFGLDLTGVWSVNVARETGILETADGEVITCGAVQLERNGLYYPAFDTKEELLEAVLAVSGLETALEGAYDDKKSSSFSEWFANGYYKFTHPTTGKSYWYANYTDYDPNGEALDDEIPFNAITPVSSEACDYTVSSTSDKVTVTAKNTIDTNVAGVYDLEYVATYEGEEVGTTSIKVVVAPNYTRTWENGKVKTLTSYYVSHPTAKYAEYNYNWAAKTVTVTYYNVDGSVNDTATNSL